MSTLLLRLKGPLQAYGSRSRFEIRDTHREPTKSAVIGALANALGWPHDASVEDLARMRFGVRVDREPRLMREYQTAQEVPTADASGSRTIASVRYLLADAAFLAGLEGDPGLLREAQAALANPAHFLFLGRKALAPSQPIHLPDGLVDLPLAEALATYPCLVGKPPRSTARLVLEADDGRVQWDQPLSSFAERTYGVRFSTTRFLDWSDHRVLD